MDPSSEAADLNGVLLGGRYRVVKLIGEGGMGAVYEAIQEDLNRRVAIKVLHARFARDPALVERFRREAQASAALGHPNIVVVNEFRAAEGEAPFLVMEFLAGETLRSLLKRTGPMSPRRAAYIATQVLSALAAAHQAGIIHRDIKPDNLFLVEGSALKDFVKVLDFGVAKLLRDGGQLTHAGMLLGTLNYMAPEQARGEAVDARTDIYALSACIFHATCGRKPIEAPSDSALLRAIQDHPAQLLATMLPNIDPAFAAIVDRGLRKLPAERYASAEDMEAALSNWNERSAAAAIAAAPIITPVMAPIAVPAPKKQAIATVAMPQKSPPVRGGTVPLRASSHPTPIPPAPVLIPPAPLPVRPTPIPVPTKGVAPTVPMAVSPPVQSPAPMAARPRAMPAPVPPMHSMPPMPPMAPAAMAPMHAIDDDDDDDDDEPQAKSNATLIVVLIMVAVIGAGALALALYIRYA